jgi:hypothetical protein
MISSTLWKGTGELSSSSSIIHDFGLSGTTFPASTFSTRSTRSPLRSLTSSLRCLLSLGRTGSHPQIPHCVPISAHHKWNYDTLLEKMWDYLKLVRAAANLAHIQHMGKDFKTRSLRTSFLSIYLD